MSCGRMRETAAVLALVLLHGCVLRLEPRAPSVERLEVKCSPPSHLRYWLDGDLRFERVSPQALPASVRCVPPDVEVGPP